MSGQLQLSTIQILLILAACIAVLLLIVLIINVRTPFPKRIEHRIRKRRFMTREQFLASWQTDKKDYPGCYVILIYDKKLILNPLHFDDIYVGQSVNVRHRVFSHLKGHGNGDVYYGLKSGCKLYILLAKCSRKKLNLYEKQLIEYFHATSSLNMTRGGSTRR